MKIVNKNKIKTDQWYRMEDKSGYSESPPIDYFYVKTVLVNNVLYIKASYFIKDHEGHVFKTNTDETDPKYLTTVDRLLEWGYAFYPMKEKDIFIEVI